MKKDPVVTGVLNIFKIKSTPKNYELLFTIFYNFIPAFVFAPYLLYIGLKYKLILLSLMGITLFIIDFMHFIRAIKKIYRKK